jgi:hypothetical protein
MKKSKAGVGSFRITAGVGGGHRDQDRDGTVAAGKGQLRGKALPAPAFHFAMPAPVRMGTSRAVAVANDVAMTDGSGTSGTTGKTASGQVILK